MLTRLGGQPLALNPDLIEKAEATPDTVITMIDGHKLVVAEPVPEVVSLIRLWRASIAAEAFSLSSSYPVPDAADCGDSMDGVAAGGVGSTSPLARVLRMPARED